MSQFKIYDHLKIPLDEIRSCTNDFADENLIRRTGFGREYIGFLSHLDGRRTVIVNRFDERHGQGFREFLTQIKMLSGYMHENLVSLVGYCHESDERIVVYKHEKHGYLDNFLGSTNLTWIQRLQISVGVARGLNYLHYGVGTHQRVLHRDIKSLNILLDENWMPRITGFELSTIGPANQPATFVVTNACGTYGYVDPVYVETSILTKESDAYSFGVLLFEILCGRTAFSRQYDDKHMSLGVLAREHYEQKKLDELIDPILRKQMDPNSLGTFSEIAYRCLNRDREERPMMGLILIILEKALEFQQIYENRDLRLLKVQVLKEEIEVPDDDCYKVKNLDHLKIPLKEIKSATCDFDAHFRIGKGGFGTVYKAKLFHCDIKNFGRASTGEFYGYMRTQSTVAIKRLDPSSMQGKSEFLQEISLLCNYRHPNVVSLVGFCDEDHENILVYEYATNHSLDRYFRGTSTTSHLTWARRLQICIDVANGINYLHNGVGENHRIIHRDLKSSNILLDRNWQAKISDFGLSRIGPANLHATFVMTDVAGTADYIDPQYWKTRRLTKESDVYSFGVVLFEVLCGRLSVLPRSKSEQVFLPDLAKRCFQKNSIYRIIDPTLKKELEESTTHMNNGSLPESMEIFASIAYKCLQENQQDRPTIAEVIEELVKSKKCDVIGVEALRISLEEIKFATNNFSDENIIGEGGFGKLYNGRRSLAHFAAQCFKDKKLEELIYDDIKEQVEASSVDTFATIAYQCLTKNPEERPKIADIVKELQKAFILQDEWEWEQRLPRDYENLIQMSKSRMSSKLTRKELHSILSSGILLKDNLWFSLSKYGANNIMISADKFEFKNLKTLKWRSVKKSRFPKVARISDASNLNVHIRIKTQVLSPGIIYGAYLVFRFCDRRKVSDGPLYVNLKYKSPSESLKTCVVVKEKDEDWMMVELYKFMHHDETLDFEMLLKSFSTCSYGSVDIFIEGISFEAVDNPTREDTHSNTHIEL